MLYATCACCMWYAHATYSMRDLKIRAVLRCDKCSRGILSGFIPGRQVAFNHYVCPLCPAAYMFT